ncbi:marR family protein [Mycobacteroides abscessus MAB_030201_1075]|nr:MarR family transcriptional regulator [Mycobacteroides abscessus subsp. bolletii 50594]EIV10601.1 transcriptional regulator, MarR family [Mycobacteroides abscessus subsp. bolletii 2B-0307]EIV11429.1 transcriptional regulator, MarR family [Mycobacteroides abscessus 4S-0206]EIV25161.1 transcriptional regulator, MarR family [Mycobacteroides abscessus 3A-0119-R]EIV36247.1 transcriptional regulator, MarR family [Mycobacteroides abscessus 3A-0122-S]EIV39704.1 transcriptional regulator, MarR famil
MSTYEESPMGILVSQMYRLLWSRASVIVRDFGVTVPQMECLAVLSAQPGISNVEIAAELRITPQAVSLVQRSLEEAGLVHRSRRQADARVLTTELTAKGRKLFERADATLREDDEEILANMTERDRVQLRRLLGGVIETISAR